MSAYSIRLMIYLMGTYLSLSLAYANPTETIINNYQLAASGDERKTEQVFSQLSHLLEQEKEAPLTLVYLGSAETLMGRDAFLPWNKIKYVEQGVGKIDKGIRLLSSQTKLLSEQEVVMGLPEYQLARATAATTLTQLPDRFNCFGRGYDLYIQLLTDAEFYQQAFSASSWVYRYAIEAALRANELQQANLWYEVMQSKQMTHPDTMYANELLLSYKGGHQ